MAVDDFGIVVGINSYPDIGTLQGPEADATDFFNWLISDRGGEVPSTHIRKIVTSDFAAQPRKPTEEIANAFDDLQTAAFVGPVAKRLGRRLYVFIAGHGAGLPFLNDPDGTDAALLLANATKNNATHVMTRVRALYFLRAGMFDEIAVFMDCCRQPVPVNPNFPNYLGAIDITTLNQEPRKFFAFATKWGLATRERTFDGVTRGVFTVALMKGLRGAAADRTGTITSNSLRDYLMVHMRDQLNPADLTNPSVPQEPHVPPQSVNLVFGTLENPPLVKVTITVPPGAANQPITVNDGQLDEVASGNTGPGPTWSVPSPLPKGLYEVNIPALNLNTTFRLSGDEGAFNVNL